MTNTKNRVMMIGTMKAGAFQDQLRLRRIKFNVNHKNGNATFSYLASDEEQALLKSFLRAI